MSTKRLKWLPGGPGIRARLAHEFNGGLWKMRAGDTTYAVIWQRGEWVFRDDNESVPKDVVCTADFLPCDGDLEGIDPWSLDTVHTGTDVAAWLLQAANSRLATTTHKERLAFQLRAVEALQGHIPPAQSQPAVGEQMLFNWMHELIYAFPGALWKPVQGGMNDEATSGDIKARYLDRHDGGRCEMKWPYGSESAGSWHDLARKIRTLDNQFLRSELGMPHPDESESAA